MLSLRLAPAGPRELEEVVTHDGQGDGFVEVLAMTPRGLGDELPIFLLIVAAQSLTPERARHGHPVREDDRGPRRRAELREERLGALEVFARAVDGLENAAVALDQFLRVYGGNEGEFEKCVAGQALLQQAAFGVQRPTQVSIGQGGHDADYQERHAAP